MKIIIRTVLHALLLCMAAFTYGAENDYHIGVYYFSGWKAHQKGNAFIEPWKSIKNYPERQPLLGWYEEDSPGLMSQQLKWMHDHSIDFVVFDWLWGSDMRPYLTHGINSYLTADSRHGVDFSIIWSNHTNYIFSRIQFEKLFKFWIEQYFFQPGYLKIDGKPVVFIFSAEIFNNNAKKLGLSSASLIAIANEMARSAGLPGIAVIGGVGGNNGHDFDYSQESGYAGFSAYNFHGPATYSFSSNRHTSNSYSELDSSYRDHWDWMLSNASGLYIIPMTSGWDRRPWGGSKDPMHDNSQSTPKEFEMHIESAKSIMDTHPLKTRKMGIICCWNEFGEGSFIEPTESTKFDYLNQINQVFRGN